MKISFDKACETISNLGVSSGDTVFSHANFALFGPIENVSSASELFQFWQLVIQSIIGKNGTMVFPSFTYSFNSKDSNGKFDVNQSASNVSGLAAHIMKTCNIYCRSLDPMLSVVSIGSLAEYITQNVGNETFGVNSVWQRMHELNAKILNFNIDSASTFLHWVEKQFHVTYRTDIPMQGTIIDSNGTKKLVEIKYYGRVSNYENKYTEEFPTYHKAASDAGVTASAYLGRGIINVSSTQDVADFTISSLRKDPKFLLGA